MLKSLSRAVPQRTLQSRTVIRPTRRFLSTAPPSQKSRSWKSSLARWGVAGGLLYYYNTSTAFAEEPDASVQQLDDSMHNVQESSLPTIDALVEEKRRRQSSILAEEQKKRLEATATADSEESIEEGEEGMGGLEDEAEQQGAFNPETGEINWDCPCLGGMAHGPCGEQFKAAFSCFVYSNEEPKGVDCIEKFKGMQDCFREHPEMYGAELEDDEDLQIDGEGDSGDVEVRKDAETVSQPEESKSKASAAAEPIPADHKSEKSRPEEQPKSTKAEVTHKSGDEGEQLLPRAAHDATSK
ncbi:hypothetical protein B7494_g6845 [Chlorociboria aeruginascens]|nr:hypothetical protein B7494_g6845 [Chlorociboria aeruginascens]